MSTVPMEGQAAAPGALRAFLKSNVRQYGMLLSLLAGAMADNLDRRRVMLGAQVFMFVVSIALAIASSERVAARVRVTDAVTLRDGRQAEPA